MSLRQVLLETPADEVPAELARLVAEFCAPISEIRAAYVGLTELTRDFQHPTRQLSVAFELSESAAATPEGDRELRLVADRFYEVMPAEVQAGGCNFLESGALGPWSEKARRVYPVGPASP